MIAQLTVEAKPPKGKSSPGVKLNSLLVHNCKIF